MNTIKSNNVSNNTKYYKSLIILFLSSVILLAYIHELIANNNNIPTLKADKTKIEYMNNNNKKYVHLYNPKNQTKRHKSLNENLYNRNPHNRVEDMDQEIRIN